MRRDELLQRLQAFRRYASRALQLLDAKPLSEVNRSGVRSLTQALKTGLEAEFRRTSPEHAQKTMSVFELSIYCPTIEEAWKQSGIRRLKIEDAVNERWAEPLEAVIYIAQKYL